MTPRLAPVRRAASAAIAALTLVASAVAAQSGPPASPEASAAIPALGVVDPSTIPATIPFEDAANHIVVDATMGSGAAVPFMLDTGAPVDLASSIVEEAGFQVVTQLTSRAAGGQTVTQDVVLVPRLSVGPVSVADTLALSGWVGPESPLSCISENGIIGANAMQGAVWQIDYQAREITVAPSVDGLDHVTDAIALDFIVQQGGIAPSPFIALLIGGQPFPFAVDTGSDGGIAIAPSELAKVGIAPDATTPTVTARATGAGGSFDLPLPYLMTDIGLNESTTIRYPVTAADVTGAVGNVGNAFLREFVVTLDWQDGKLYLDPVSADGTVPPPTVRSAGVGWDGQQLVVASIVEDGPAASAGLALGDVVTAVDGAPVTTREDACRVMRSGAGTIETAAGTFELGPVEGFLPEG